MAINKIGQDAFSNTDMVMNTYTATAGQTAFTLSKSSTTNAIIVHINDVMQQPTTDYSVSGTTLTLSSGAAVGDDVRVRTLSENPLGVASSAFTTANARSSVSVTTGSASGGGALSYDSGTGVFTFQPGTSNTAATLRTAVSVGSEGTAAGDGALAYNNSTGVFTYTPPTLASLIGGSPSSNQVLAWNGSAWSATSTVSTILNTAGNVGIGTASPTSYDGEADELVVVSSGHTGITIASTGSNQRTNLYFSDGTSGTEKYIGGFSYDHNDNSLFTRTLGIERMRIDSSGNVGIGTSSPNNKLDVNGGIVCSPNTDGKDTFELSTNDLDEGRLRIKNVDTTTVQIRAGGVSYFNGGDVAIGTTDSLMTYDSNSTKLTVYDSTGSAQSGYLELGANATVNGYNAGAIQWINNNNSDATTTDTAGSKCVSQIRSVIKTSDSNAGDDSGGTLQFWTKQEGEKLHNTARLEHPNAYHRVDMVVTAEELPGDGGANANAFITTKAKGNYYNGLNITSSSGHVGGWIGHWNGGSTSRQLQARVGGTGLNVSDTLSFHIDHQGTFYYDAHPTDGGTSANAILQPANGKFERSTASSRKLKENIKDIELDCSKIHDLKVRQFDYKSNYVTNPDAAARKDIGLIAEETHAVEPTWAVMGYVDEATCTFKTDDNIPAGESKHAMDIHWRRLQVAMLKEIQRLNDRITTLENA